MNSTFPFLVVLLILLNGCQKDAGFRQAILLNTNSTNMVIGTDLTGCDDTSAFKSDVDLQPLAFLQSCYSCNAVKEVPGLGEIPWTGNCEVYFADSTLAFRFNTYQPYFQEFLLRETLAFNYIPNSIGIHPVFNWVDWAQDPEKSFGSYARSWDDGDVSDGLWGTDTHCTNYIEITRLDLEDWEVEGRFEIHLKMKEQGTNGILYSERINFLNGKFKAEIEKY
ncbi:MAG: hypothetical protein J0M29_09515 [Chitinophagales bacterium]|nr:hypothetical protein [Chitinophagales bacterium]